MAIQLRKKAPYFCRSKDINGKFNHLDQALSEDEGDLCADCQKKADEAREKFFHKPIYKSTHLIDVETYRGKPIWA